MRKLRLDVRVRQEILVAVWQMTGKLRHEEWVLEVGFELIIVLPPPG